MAVIRVNKVFCPTPGVRSLAVGALVLGISLSPAPALAAPYAGHGEGSGKGHVKQVSGGRNTANTPEIASAPYQLSAGRRNVNAAAGNNGVAAIGLQQEASVSVFSNTLNGRCRMGVKDCGISQDMATGEISSRGAARTAGRAAARAGKRAQKAR
ncbi:hypothetical protein [Microbispora sp. H11081]|uniref:hypothetical protein n=1 Tax=Microbispora sp. H11081 TaxID=2729107 RepID=UPI0014746646|nr:hypothetical protein [Microbispora sp. H11081]